MSERMPQVRQIGRNATNHSFVKLFAVGQGDKTAESAERLHLRIKTIETYRDRIREKLNLRDGTELALYATQWMLANG
jgi:DNA-binding NarL/FixJ family response regulator